MRERYDRDVCRLHVAVLVGARKDGLDLGCHKARYARYARGGHAQRVHTVGRALGASRPAPPVRAVHGRLVRGARACELRTRPRRRCPRARPHSARRTAGRVAHSRARARCAALPSGRPERACCCVCARRVCLRTGPRAPNLPNSGDSLANTVARAATREWSRGCEKQAAADEAAASSIALTQV